MYLTPPSLEPLLSQNDLVDVTDARRDAKFLVADAKATLEKEEVKISDRVWLIRVLETEVRVVIENLTDKIQALKREQMISDAELQRFTALTAAALSPATTTPLPPRLSPTRNSGGSGNSSFELSFVSSRDSSQQLDRSSSLRLQVRSAALGKATRAEPELRSPSLAKCERRVCWPR